MVWRCSVSCYGKCDRCVKKLGMIGRDEFVAAMDWKIRQR